MYKKKYLIILVFDQSSPDPSFENPGGSINVTGRGQGGGKRQKFFHGILDCWKYHSTLINYERGKKKETLNFTLKTTILKRGFKERKKCFSPNLWTML